MTYESADTLEIVTDPDALRALEPEWDELWAGAGDEYVTQQFAWCWAAWETVSKPLGRRLHCVVTRRDGKLVLVWPFVAFRQGLWLRARPLGPEVSEYTSVLVARDEQMDARVAAAWKRLCATIRCDTVLLPFVPADTPVSRLMAALGRPMLTDSTPMSSARHDAQNAADLLDSRSLRRRRRQLEKRGRVGYELVTEAGRRADIIAWAVRTKTAWLARTGGSRLWHSAELYRAFLVAATADERVAVFALTLDGLQVAACVSRIDNLRVEQFLSAYDEAYRDYSPGQLLRLENVRWAFERGLDYDLRIGEQSYKSEWRNRRSEAVSYSVAISAWGTLFVRGRGAQRALRRAATRASDTGTEVGPAQPREAEDVSNNRSSAPVATPVSNSKPMRSRPA